MSGETAAGTSTFSTILAKCTDPAPAETQVAPIKPPNRACDELDGKPPNHVTKFHTIAPTSPPNTIAGPILASSTNPLEIVLATSTDSKAPTRFSTAEMATAARGRRAPVAIDVAIEFAVSWKQLVKSKTRAVNTTSTTSNEASTRPPNLWKSSRKVPDGSRQLLTASWQM